MVESRDKTCFIIMPISDADGYAQGHFKRVYEHLIKPACSKAGFNAVRADDVNNSNVIIVDVLKSILNSEMALCDLSSRNPNVLYELGIRQAFNKPITLIKDSKTQRIFDIQGIRDIEYDESLRVDKVQHQIDEIANAIKNTYESQGKEIQSLIQILNITPAQISKGVEMSLETTLILQAISSLNSKINVVESRLKSEFKPFIIPSYDSSDAESYDLSKYQSKKFNRIKLAKIKDDDANS